MSLPYCGSAPEFNFRAEASQRFADYWFGLPREGFLPPRSVFDPAHIPGLLPMILLRDVETDGSSRYRLAGTGVGELLGENLTARDARTVMPAATGKHHEVTTRLMFDQPCGICVVLKMTTAGGRSLFVENLSFPFQPAADGRRQTLGLLSPLSEGTSGRQPNDAAKISASDEVRFIDIGAGVPELPPLG